MLTTIRMLMRPRVVAPVAVLAAVLAAVALLVTPATYVSTASVILLPSPTSELTPGKLLTQEPGNPLANANGGPTIIATILLQAMNSRETQSALGDGDTGVLVSGSGAGKGPFIFFTGTSQVSPEAARDAVVRAEEAARRQLVDIQRVVGAPTSQLITAMTLADPSTPVTDSSRRLRTAGIALFVAFFAGLELARRRELRAARQRGTTDEPSEEPVPEDLFEDRAVEPSPSLFDVADVPADPATEPLPVVPVLAAEQSAPEPLTPEAVPVASELPEAVPVAAELPEAVPVVVELPEESAPAAVDSPDGGEPDDAAAPLPTPAPLPTAAPLPAASPEPDGARPGLIRPVLSPGRRPARTRVRRDPVRIARPTHTRRPVSPRPPASGETRGRASRTGLTVAAAVTLLAAMTVGIQSMLPRGGSTTAPPAAVALTRPALPTGTVVAGGPGDGGATDAPGAPERGAATPADEPRSGSKALGAALAVNRNVFAGPAQRDLLRSGRLDLRALLVLAGLAAHGPVTLQDVSEGPAPRLVLAGLDPTARTWLAAQQAPFAPTVADEPGRTVLTWT